MKSHSYSWYVSHNTFGRVIVCQISVDSESYVALMALWPWERRHAPTVLIKQMQHDAQQIIASIQLHAAMTAT